MKLFAISVPVLCKLITYYVIGVVALSVSGMAFAGEMQAATMREQTTLDSMPHGKAMTDCFPCGLCCMALPPSTRTTGNGDQPAVTAALSLLWSDPTVRLNMFDQHVALCSGVALRILYCCWRN
jgi:hypothetical protein